MKRRNHKPLSGSITTLACAIFIAAACTQTASANAFRNPPGSSSAIALDGAKSVMVDDASALSINPANLTKIDRPAAMVSFTFIDADATFKSPLGFEADTRNTFKTLPNIYIATPLDGGRIVAGVGITTPYGQSVEWSKESTLPFFTEMILVDIAPTLAFKLSDTVSIGGGFDFYLSQLQTKQLVPWSAVTGNPAAPTGESNLKGDGMDVGATMGISWNVTEKQHLAAVYHSAFDITYEGDTRVSNIPAELALFVKGRTDFESEIKFPAIASIGYAIDITETVTIGTEIEWIEYSRFKTLPIDLGANSSLGLFPDQIPQKWDDIWTYGFSGKWQYNEAIVLRGSYKYLESPIPDMTAAPTLPDGDKHTVGIGIGWKGERQSVDAGYTYSFIDDRKVTENQNPMYIGEYEMNSHIFSIAYSYAL